MGPIPAVVGIVALTAVTTYFAATFLGGLVLNATSARRTVPQVARMAIMAFCGVNVPRSVFPAPVRRFAGLLPVTHGLDAIRGLLANAPAATVLRDIGLEVLVGAGWLALSLLTFQRLADAGRRDGSIVFSSV